MTSEHALRQMRNKIFDYPPEKDEQASRVLRYLKARYLRQRGHTAQHRGPQSGLTRAELHQSRTCETDWF